MENNLYFLAIEKGKILIAVTFHGCKEVVQAVNNCATKSLSGLTPADQALSRSIQMELRTRSAFQSGCRN
jgi:hypothetical protein